jgi:hypothetical protein
MEFYVRQIRPYILNNITSNAHPVDGYWWISEDMEEKLREEIVIGDTWSKLIFLDRFVNVKSEIIKDIEEVIHGKWINSYPEIEPNPMCMYGICSNCGFEQSISDKLNYCPNCGAKMDLK